MLVLFIKIWLVLMSTVTAGFAVVAVLWIMSGACCRKLRTRVWEKLQ